MKEFGAVLVAVLCTTVTGCAEMNNAQTGAVGGAVIGGVTGWAASRAFCNNNDVACRNRLVGAGALGGAAVGYVTGNEMDLQLAQKAAEELRLQGYKPQIETRMVEADVPYDQVSNVELSNAQLQTYPKERVVTRKKSVQSLASMTVPLKNKNDPVERAYISNYLLGKANQMSGRQELVIPSNSPYKERVAIANVAKQKNVLVRESKGANAISLASL
jgi:hypothetical protein